MKKPALIISSLIIIVITLSIVRIFVSNQVATAGVLLDKTQKQVNIYRLENSLLAEKFYEAASLTKISEKAAKIGFMESKNDFVLSGQVPVALKQ